MFPGVGAFCWKANSTIHFNAMTTSQPLFLGCSTGNALLSGLKALCPSPQASLVRSSLLLPSFLPLKVHQITSVFSLQTRTRISTLVQRSNHANLLDLYVLSHNIGSECGSLINLTDPNCWKQSTGTWVSSMGEL
jgi:hypothetical protein